MWLSDLVCWYQKNPESWSYHDLWKLCSFYTQEDPTLIHCQTSCSRMLEQSGRISPHFKDWCWSARTGSGGFYLKTSCWHCSDTSKNNENTMHQRIVKYLKGFWNICPNFWWSNFSIFWDANDWTNIRFFSQLCVFQAAHFDIPEVLAVGRQENWQDWGYFSLVLNELLHQRLTNSKSPGTMATQAESAGAEAHHISSSKLPQFGSNFIQFGCEFDAFSGDLLCQLPGDIRVRYLSWDLVVLDEKFAKISQSHCRVESPFFLRLSNF